MKYFLKFIGLYLLFPVIVICFTSLFTIFCVFRYIWDFKFSLVIEGEDLTPLELFKSAGDLYK